MVILRTPASVILYIFIDNMIDGKLGNSDLTMAGFKLQITGVGSSVTRLGDLLDFGQLFKAFGNN